MAFLTETERTVVTPQAYLVLASDRRIAGSCSHVAVPMSEISLALAREIKAQTLVAIRFRTPARFRFAALCRPEELVDWAARRDARIAVEIGPPSDLDAEVWRRGRA